MGHTVAAQAVRLVSALRDQMQAMAAQLADVERKFQAAGRSKDRRAAATQLQVQAAELRRGMEEAQALIERLKRRYLDSVGQPAPEARGMARQAHPAGRTATSRQLHWSAPFRSLVTRPSAAPHPANALFGRGRFFS